MGKLLVTLSGGTSNGKSTTLNKLANEICKTYEYTEILYRSYSNLDKELNKDKSPKDKIIIIKDVGDNKLTIGINTAGDTGYIANNSISLFDKNRGDICCDIVICATKATHRGTKGSISTINKFYRENKNEIKLIPLFKMLFNFTNFDDKRLEDENDDEMVKIIMNQLAKEI